MLINLSGPHILRLILSWSIFYYVLNLTYHTRFPDKIRLQKYTLLVFISVILHLFLAGFALPIIFVIIYWQLHSKENNYYLINLIILNLLVKLLAVLIPTPLIMLLFPTGFDNYACSLTVGLLEFILSIAFVYFYNYYKWPNLIKNGRSPQGINNFWRKSLDSAFRGFSRPRNHVLFFKNHSSRHRTS